MPYKLPNPPQVAGLPQQDVSVKAAACHDTEGMAVNKSRYPMGMQCGCAPHQALGHIRYLDGRVQRAADQAQLWQPGQLQLPDAGEEVS